MAKTKNFDAMDGLFGTADEPKKQAEAEAEEKPSDGGAAAEEPARDEAKETGQKRRGRPPKNRQATAQHQADIDVTRYALDISELVNSKKKLKNVRKVFLMTPEMNALFTKTAEDLGVSQNELFNTIMEKFFKL